MVAKMGRFTRFFGLSCLTATSFAFPSPVDHQYRLRAELNSHQKADAVKEAFQFAWDGYIEHAYPNDELRPVSNGASNPLNGWGATAVDALSTALMMELPDVVDKVLDHVAQVDYSQTDGKCSLFETTIRYLGGMISGYDMLTGPLSHLASDSGKVKALLDQSAALADNMKFAFDSESGVPWNGLNITHQTTDGATTNGIATIGTLVLEWTRLSDLTGNPEYAELTQRAEEHLLNPKPESSEPFPGLIGHLVEISTGEFQDADVSWEAGADSFYEYLIKMYIYDKHQFKDYKKRWILAAESSIEHLKSHPSTRPDITYIAAYSGEIKRHSQHLACFAGGNFILGGRELDREDFVEFGLELVDGCHNTYSSSRTRIGPESWSWEEDRVPDDQKEFYKENGFYYSNAGYGLRPEVIESYYYAYRITGDRKYQDWAWDAFVAINETTRTGSGFSNIRNVNEENGGSFSDSMPSFLLAETFKYAYMIHAPEADWQVSRDGKDKFVYNTEAHPFRVRS